MNATFQPSNHPPLRQPNSQRLKMPNVTLIALMIIFALFALMRNFLQWNLPVSCFLIACIVPNWLLCDIGMLLLLMQQHFFSQLMLRYLIVDIVFLVGRGRVNWQGCQLAGGCRAAQMSRGLLWFGWLYWFCWLLTFLLIGHIDSMLWRLTAGPCGSQCCWRWFADPRDRNE